MKVHLIDYPNKDLVLLHIRHEMSVRTFADKIKGCIDYEPKDIPNEIYDVIEELGYKREIKRCWIHFMEPGSNHAAGHKHETDIAVIYLQAYPNCGDLLFLDSVDSYSPVEDTMVIVPALETHAMTENKSTHVRIAMGFPIEKKPTLQTIIEQDFKEAAINITKGDKA